MKRRSWQARKKKRIFPDRSPVLSTIVILVLALVPGVNGILGLVLLVLIFMRIGGKFPLGYFASVFILVAIIFFLVLGPKAL